MYCNKKETYKFWNFKANLEYEIEAVAKSQDEYDDEYINTLLCWRVDVKKVKFESHFK